MKTPEVNKQNHWRKESTFLSHYLCIPFGRAHPVVCSQATHTSCIFSAEKSNPLLHFNWESRNLKHSWNSTKLLGVPGWVQQTGRHGITTSLAMGLYHRPGATLPKGHIYPLSIREQKAMEEYIEEALNQESIPPSTSPGASSSFYFFFFSLIIVIIIVFGVKGPCMCLYILQFIKLIYYSIV